MRAIIATKDPVTAKLVTICLESGLGASLVFYKELSDAYNSSKRINPEVLIFDSEYGEEEIAQTVKMIRFDPLTGTIPVFILVSEHNIQNNYPVSNVHLLPKSEGLGGIVKMLKAGFSS